MTSEIELLRNDLLRTEDYYSGDWIIGCAGLPLITPANHEQGEGATLHEMLQGIVDYVDGGLSIIPEDIILGDLLYGSGPDTLARLPGNTAAAKRFLTQTGTGTVSAAPAWAALVAGDITGALGYTPVNRAGDTLTGFLVAHADPTLPMHLATRQYVDAAAAGIQLKDPCVAATTANITLSGTQTIDGVAVTAGQRVLVKNQTAPAENGIYVVAAGAWSRATDMDANSEVVGALTFVSGGTTHGNEQWRVSTTGSITLGTTAIAWALFYASEDIAVTAPLQKVGNLLSIQANGISNGLFRQSGALAVVGRSANSTGDVADIAAVAGSGAVLRESGNTIGWGTLATAGIGNAQVTYAKIQNVAGLSIFGQAANSAGVGADITAGTDAHVLRRSGTTLGFGTIGDASISGLAWSKLSGVPGGFSGFANPTATIGLTAVNGSATTAMRSDAAPALSQAIAPTWSAIHQWNLGAAAAEAIRLEMAQPGSAGTRDSHWIQLRGTSFDTVGHNSDWRFYVDVTSNAGASTFRFQSRIDSNSFADAFSISNTGAGAFAGALSASNLSGTNTGDQTITLTGDVTGSGTGSFAATIANQAVTLAKMANIATASILGRNTAGAGSPEVLTTLPNGVQDNITRLGTVTVGTWSAGTIATTRGGTGLATIGSANQVLGVNAAANGLEYKSIVQGSANRVTVAHSANAITLSLPQDIHTAATPTFARVIANQSPAGGITPHFQASAAGGGSYGFHYSGTANTNERYWDIFGGSQNLYIRLIGDLTSTTPTNAITITRSAMSVSSITLAGAVSATAGLTVTGGNTSATTLSLSSTLTGAGDWIFTQTDHSIRSNASDGSDNRRLTLLAGSATGESRGAQVHIYGNEYATTANRGQLSLMAGNVSGSGAGSIKMGTGGTDRVIIEQDGDFFYSGNYFGIGPNQGTAGNEALHVGKDSTQSLLVFRGNGGGNNPLRHHFQHSNSPGPGQTGQTIEQHFEFSSMLDGTVGTEAIRLAARVRVGKEADFTTTGTINSSYSIYTVGSNSQNLGFYQNRNGDVAIQHTNPSTALDVNGNINAGGTFENSSGWNRVISIQGTNHARFRLRTSAGGTPMDAAFAVDDSIGAVNAYIGTVTNHTFAIVVGGSTSSPRMFFNTSGYVGLNTTTPGNYLGATHVSSSADRVMNIQSGSSGSNGTAVLALEGHAASALWMADRNAAVNQKWMNIYTDGGFTTFHPHNDNGTTGGGANPTRLVAFQIRHSDSTAFAYKANIGAGYINWFGIVPDFGVSKQNDVLYSNWHVASDSAGSENQFTFYRSRGSLASPDTVQAGDSLGSLYWAVHSGSNILTAVRMYAVVGTGAAWSAGQNVPTVFNIATSTGNGASTPRFTVNGMGYVGLNNFAPISSTDMIGSVGESILVTAATTVNLDVTHRTIVCTTNGTTVNLPSASGCTRRLYTIVSRGGAFVSIQAAGSDTIYIGTSSGTSFAIPNGSVPLIAGVTLQSDGSSWNMVGTIRDLF